MKKIFLALISLIMAFSLYAQNSKPVGLSDSDVKNWAKNCVSIQKEFEKIGIDTNDSFTVAVSEKQKAESILQKYGISNPNSIEKYSMILQCAAILKAESELDEQSKAMMKLMKVDPLGDLKKTINSKDYNVVASNSKAVLKAVDELDANSFESEASAASAGDDYSYGDDDLSYGDEDLADFYSRLAKSAENVANERSNLNMREANEEGKYVKSMYEAISKASGDSGLLYKSSKQASKYKKTSYKKGTKVKIDYYWDTEDKNRSKYELIFDLDKKTAEFNFDWKVAKVDYSDFLNGYSVESTTKTLKYTITSVEYYYLTEDIGRSYGEGMEYVIKTKEGLVLHAWIQWDGYFDACQQDIRIKGLPESLTETRGWTTE